MDKSKDEELIEYFKKEEVQTVIIELIIQFNQVFSSSWFTLDDCLRIFKDSNKAQLVDVIGTLHLCGFLLVNKKKNRERFRMSTNKFKKVTDVLRK